MRFSVIIPAKNEEKFLPRLLIGLKRQEGWRWGRDFEVIVLEGYSSDRTYEIAKSYGCRVVRTKLWPIGKIRNFGARIAKGEIFVFMDADIEVLPGFMSEIDRKINRCSFLLYFSRLARKFGMTGNFFIFLARMISFLGLVAKVPSHPGGGMVIPRDLFWMAGGFDENMESNEDTNMISRLYRTSAARGCCLKNVRTSPRRYENLYSFVKSLLLSLSTFGTNKWWAMRRIYLGGQRN